MSANQKPAHTVHVDLSDDDLDLLEQALNEVANGVHLSDAEFETRVGFTRAEARSLLDKLSQAKGQQRLLRSRP